MNNSAPWAASIIAGAVAAVAVLVTFYQWRRDLRVRLDSVHDKNLEALTAERIEHYGAFMTALEPMSRRHTESLIADRSANAIAFADVLQGAIFGPIGVLSSTETRELIVYARGGWIAYADHRLSLREVNSRMWAVHQGLRSDLGIFQPGWEPEVSRRRKNALPLTSADIATRVREARHLNYDIYGAPRGVTLNGRDYDGVILDMDGLLIDSEPAYRAGWEGAVREFGYELDDALFAQLLGRSTPNVRDTMASAWGPQVIDQFDQIVLRRRAIAEEMKPYAAMPGAVELVEWLFRHGVPSGVASSTTRAKIPPLLAAAGIALDRIDVIVGGDEVTNGKPAPDIFALAATRLNLAVGRCLVLEDAPNGIRAATAAGADSVLIPTLPLVAGPATPVPTYQYGSLVELMAEIR